MRSLTTDLRVTCSLPAILRAVINDFKNVESFFLAPAFSDFSGEGGGRLRGFSLGSGKMSHMTSGKSCCVWMVPG